MPVRQRARNIEDKRARREAIVSHAAALLGEHEYGRITMAHVATAAGLAKGTLYLYFGSKEELFLGLLERELIEWFEELRGRLRASANLTADDIATSFTSSLERRRTLGTLLVILHTILETNVRAETARAFKGVLRDQILGVGSALEDACPALPRGHGPRTLLRMYALLVGLQQLATSSSMLQDILAAQDMEVLRVDLRRDLTEGLRDLLHGASHPLGGGA